MAKVSVIIPTYNHGEFIALAINSALNQSVRDLEVIVVDNHSTDRTEEIVRAIQDPRLHYFRFDNSGIIAAGRNFGAAKATGEFLSFLDSDDYWVPEKLERQLPHLGSLEVVCVGSNYEPVGDTVNTRNMLAVRNSSTWRDFSYRDVLLANPVMTSSALVRRSDFERLGGFNISADYAFIEDWELWLRLAQTGMVRVLPEKLIRYRVVRTKGRDRRAIAKNLSKLLDSHVKLDLLSHRDYSYARGNLAVNTARAYLDENDPIASRMYWEGIRFSKGIHNRLRSLGGLILASLPRTLRALALRIYYILIA